MVLLFILFLICFYHSYYIFFIISDLVYISRDLYIFNQVKLRPTYLLSSLDASDLYTRKLGYLVNALTDKANVYTKKKS